MIQQKTDDDDSGNDEPSDLPSVLDLMAEQQQQQPVEAAHDDGREEEEEEVEDQQSHSDDEEVGLVAAARREGEGQAPPLNLAINPDRHVPLPLLPGEVAAAVAAERLGPPQQLHCNQNNNNNNSNNFGKRLQQLLQQQGYVAGGAAQPPMAGAAAAAVDRLAEQLSLLSTPRPLGESATASRVVQSLPPERKSTATSQFALLFDSFYATYNFEFKRVNSFSSFLSMLCCVVLMHVFSHLDDISLWSASRVCRRWASIIHQSVSNEQWSKFTLRRWPLFRPNYSVGSGGWASVFSQLVDSSPCLYCLHRSNVEEEGANWEPSNHWRNNRLCNEWRMVNLHIE